MKSFEVKKTNASVLSTWSVASFFAHFTASACLYGVIRYYASYDQYLLYLVIYNIISAFTSCLFGLLSDMTMDKNIGARLGAMIATLGFVIPSNWGLTFKVVLLGIGVGMLNIWTLSGSLKCEQKHYGIGLFLSLSALGTAVGRFKPGFGFFSVAFMMIAVALSPSDGRASFSTEKKNHGIKLLIGVLNAGIMFVLTILLSMCFTLFRYGWQFGWNYSGKTWLLCGVAFAVGILIGDLTDKKLGSGVTAIFSLGGGMALYSVSDGKKALCLLSIMLFGMILPILYRRAVYFLPEYSGFIGGLIVSGIMLGSLLFQYSDSGLTLFKIIAIMVLAVIYFICFDLHDFFISRKEKKE